MAQSIKRRRASGSGGTRKSRLGLWTTIVLLLLAAAYLGVLELSRPHVDGDRLSFTEFVNAVVADRVDDALILEEDEYVTGTYERPDGVKAEYNAPLFRELKRDVVLGYLVPGEVDTEIDQQVGKRVAALAAFLLPGIIIVVLFGYLILARRRGTGLFAIRSGARKIRSDDSNVRFTDVAGQEAAVGELKEIAEFLTDPARFTALGAAVPKGVLLFGPPGCGKTMLARALAGEARASFFSISGSDFVELYVGVGASRVRDLFREARENAPSLIFIDELDSIGRARGVAGANEGNQEHEQALNQVLAEMDGFNPSEGIIVVAATNRPDILDPALLRPGRFDRTVGLEKPDEEARLAILNIHARNKAIGNGVDLAKVASRAHGMSGADLASVMNEAALLAGRAGHSAVGQSELDQALSRVQEAPERQRRLSLRTQTIARRFTGADKVGFGDIAGQDKAVEELAEIREFLADPERFTSLGASIPKGVLLYGPPGCGKTLLAKALASESGAAFLSVSASEFVERYAGGGASRVRDLFAEARSMPPAIIFLDEIDGIGRSRAGMTGGALMGGEVEQTLTQVLSEMDGFETRDGLIVVGATNRPDVLDPALLRPGRFDRTIGLELPDNQGRLAILKLHARGKVLGADTDLEGLANKAYGLTGADLAGIMNEAALLAGRQEREAVFQADLDAALARVMEAPDRQRRLSLRGRNVGRRYSGAERVTFADVAGVDDAVTELAEVKQFLTEPSRFTDMGARVPRGILLTGPPGCGKTLLAKAVAGEANAAFFSVAATEFVEVWVGEGAARVRDLFADARSMAPSIVFIDEIDGVGGRRGNWDGHKERENTLNQLLVELDGFDGRHAVIVMAATNRPDMLDSALTRPGRFDRQVSIRMPDRAGRRAILELYARGKRLASDVDLDAVAGLTTGMSGADLENIMNEAILFATRNHRPEIDQAAMEEGIDRAVLGIGSRVTLLTDEERRIVAYHEVGHALVAMSLPDATPPHKITIIPRGGTLGRCQIVDDHDRTVISYSRLLDDMASYLGGWVAERLVFGQVGVGSANDLEQVGRMARQMVKTYGMSDLMGPLGYPDQWSGTGSTRPSYSEDSARSIDEEVRRLVDEATRRAEEVLTTKRPALDRLAEALVEKETLTAEELGELSGSVRRVGKAKAGAAGGKPVASSTARRRTTRT